MRKQLITLGLIMAIALFAGCGDDGSGGTSPNGDAVDSSPAAAIKGMLALAEAGKWEEYVSTYYGERHKMDKPVEQTKKVAARIEKAGAQLIEMLKACVDQEPTLSDDGTKATFPNQLTLHKDDGQWGFHL